MELESDDVLPGTFTPVTSCHSCARKLLCEVILPNASFQIHLPPDQYFSCTSCGKCCRTPWRVKVGEEEAVGIEDTEIFQKLKRDGFIPLPVIDGQRQIGRKETGHCQFLSAEGCEIHAEAGAEAKPSVYPLVPGLSPRTYMRSCRP